MVVAVLLLVNVTVRELLDPAAGTVGVTWDSCAQETYCGGVREVPLAEEPAAPAGAPEWQGRLCLTCQMLVAQVRMPVMLVGTRFDPE